MNIQMPTISKWLNKIRLLIQDSSIQNMDAEEKATARWFTAASVRSIKSRNLSDACATFRSAHTRCKRVITRPCCHGGEGDACKVLCNPKLLIYLFSQSMARARIV